MQGMAPFQKKRRHDLSMGSKQGLSRSPRFRCAIQQPAAKPVMNCEQDLQLHFSFATLYKSPVSTVQTPRISHTYTASPHPPFPPVPIFVYLSTQVPPHPLHASVYHQRAPSGNLKVSYTSNYTASTSARRHRSHL